MDIENLICYRFLITPMVCFFYYTNPFINMDKCPFISDNSGVFPRHCFILIKNQQAISLIKLEGNWQGSLHTLVEFFDL